MNIANNSCPDPLPLHNLGTSEKWNWRWRWKRNGETAPLSRVGIRVKMTEKPAERGLTDQLYARIVESSTRCSSPAQNLASGSSHQGLYSHIPESAAPEQFSATKSGELAHVVADCDTSLYQLLSRPKVTGAAIAIAGGPFGMHLVTRLQCSPAWVTLLPRCWIDRAGILGREGSTMQRHPERFAS